MRRIVELEKAEIVELLDVITHGKLKLILKTVKDRKEDTLHIAFRHEYHGKDCTDYILIHPMGFFGSISATYSVVTLDNGDNISIETLSRRFYEAKRIRDNNIYPFIQRGETA